MVNLYCITNLLVWLGLARATGSLFVGGKWQPCSYQREQAGDERYAGVQGRSPHGGAH